MRTQDHAAKAMNDRQIDGMIALRVTPESRLYRGMNTLGQRVRLTCEGTNWGGAGSLYLWGCVLEKFLANYAGINSYIRFELEDTITGVVYTWPLRQGLT
jgi:type VI secretion system protein ImpG